MSTRSFVLAPLLRVLPSAGYGLWAVLGGALALDAFMDGRGDVLVPLALGLLLVATGVLAASASLGGRLMLRSGTRPSGEGLLAMATVLPMLAVAGLARGDNAFWATRFSGAMLALASLATLLAVSRPRRPQRSWLSRFDHMLAALFSGSLWLWLCMSFQESGGAANASVPIDPWPLVLLSLGLGLGLLEHIWWRRLEEDSRPLQMADAPLPALTGRRFLTTLLTFVVPCLLVAAAYWAPAQQVLLAALAALVCEIGLGLQNHLHDALPRAMLASRS